MYKRPMQTKKQPKTVNESKNISKLPNKDMYILVPTFIYCPIMGAQYVLMKDYGRVITFY